MTPRTLAEAISGTFASEPLTIAEEPLSKRQQEAMAERDNRLDARIARGVEAVRDSDVRHDTYSVRPDGRYGCFCGEVSAGFAVHSTHRDAAAVAAYEQASRVGQ